MNASPADANKDKRKHLGAVTTRGEQSMSFHSAEVQTEPKLAAIVILSVSSLENSEAIPASKCVLVNYLCFRKVREALQQNRTQAMFLNTSWKHQRQQHGAGDASTEPHVLQLIPKSYKSPPQPAQRTTNTSHRFRNKPGIRKLPSKDWLPFAPAANNQILWLLLKQGLFKLPLHTPALKLN